MQDKIISEQAEWERERPVKPFLDKVIYMFKYKDFSKKRFGLLWKYNQLVNCS
mgnify:CR=1 FL=1